MQYLELVWELIIGLRMALFSSSRIKKIFVYPDKLNFFPLTEKKTAHSPFKDQNPNKLLISILFLLNIMVLHAQKEPTNQHFWYTLETTAAPETIWSIWTDVDNWKKWDTGLKDAQMDTDFALNAKGFILSLEDRKAKFKITEYIEGQSYTYKTSLPLGGLYVKRFLTEKNGKTTFTHEVWFAGLTKGVFSKLLGKQFHEMLPEVLENIKIIAENDRS